MSNLAWTKLTSWYIKQYTVQADYAMMNVLCWVGPDKIIWYNPLCLDWWKLHPLLCLPVLSGQLLPSNLISRTRLELVAMAIPPWLLSTWRKAHTHHSVVPSSMMKSCKLLRIIASVVLCSFVRRLTRSNLVQRVCEGSRAWWKGKSSSQQCPDSSTVGAMGRQGWRGNCGGWILPWRAHGR